MKSNPNGRTEHRSKSPWQKVVHRATGVAESARQTGRDLLTLSSEALEFKQRQERNFGMGVYEWGKGTVDTVVGIARDPVGTARGLGELAQNPVLNPVGGLANAAREGQSPREAMAEGFRDLRAIGSGLVDGYKDVYREHGAAGLAGNLAPDVVTAVVSGGTATAARTGGRAVAKEVVQESVEQAGSEIAEEATDQTVRGAAGRVGRDVAGEVAPGYEDVAVEAQEESGESWSFLRNLRENFS